MKSAIIQYHGGKWVIAPWIISHFPEHETYVELFGGAGSVLFRKPISEYEIINDISDEIVNLFRVLRSPVNSRRLYRGLKYTPYARTEYYRATMDHDCPVERARRMIVRCNMNIGTKSNKKKLSGFRVSLGRKDAHFFARKKEMIKDYCDRLKNVIIENRCYSALIDQFDSKDTLFYLDPPYMPGTRTTIKRDGALKSSVYDHDLTFDNHVELLRRVQNIKGMVVISGYDSELYNTALAGWRKEEKMTYTLHGSKRKECLWLSPNIETRQGRLFE